MPDSWILLCFCLSSMGFFGFAGFGLSLELAVEVTYPMETAMSECMVHTIGQMFSVLLVFVGNKLYLVSFELLQIIIFSGSFILFIPGFAIELSQHLPIRRHIERCFSKRLHTLCLLNYGCGLPVRMHLHNWYKAFDESHQRRQAIRLVWSRKYKCVFLVLSIILKIFWFCMISGRISKHVFFTFFNFSCLGAYEITGLKDLV